MTVTVKINDLNKKNKSRSRTTKKNTKPAGIKLFGLLKNKITEDPVTIQRKLRNEWN
jgi:hypothetical protein